MDRERRLALLEDQHAFPGRYAFRAFVQPGGREAVEAAVRAACAPTGELVEVDARPSRTGKWLSLRLHVHVAEAADVLRLYEVLHALDEVALTL